MNTASPKPLKLDETVDRRILNMEIKVVIADDEPLARRLLVRLVDAQNDLSIAGVAHNGRNAESMIAELRPDLVFLDVNMPKMTGVEITEAIQQMPVAPFVVFVTAFDHYATTAFDLDVLDYLVKPIEKERFARAVDRARKAIKARRVEELGQEIAAVASPEPERPTSDAPYVIIKQRDELIRVPEDDIYWLEAASQYVNIHTKDEQYVVSEPLKRYFSRLASPAFRRVHRSAVVNVQKVHRVLRRANGVHELELANGTRVALSRSRRALVDELLNASTSNRNAR